MLNAVQPAPTTHARTRARASSAAALLLAALATLDCATPSAPTETAWSSGDEQRIEARVEEWHDLMGQSRSALSEGHLKDARAAVLQAVDVSLEFPDDQPQQLNNLETALLVVEGYRGLDDPASARSLLVEIVGRCRAQGGDARSLELEILQSAGQLELELGNPYGATEIFAQMRRRSEHSLGVQHPTTILATSSLARTKLALGQVDRALALSTSALREVEEARGPDHLDTASVLFIHARVQSATGELSASNESLEQALAIQRAHFGTSPQDELMVLGQLVEQYFALYDYKRAQTLAEESIALYRSVFRSPQPESIVHYSILSLIHSRRGEFDRAIERATESFETTREIFGAGSEQVARTLVQLAATQLTAGHYQDALATLEEAVGERAATVDPHSLKPGALVRLAECEAGLGNFGRAEALFAVALEESNSTYGAGSVATAEHISRVARFYAQRGEVERAQALIEPALMTLLESRRRPDTLLVEALATRAHVAAALGNPSLAGGYFAQAIEAGRLVFGPDTPRLESIEREADAALSGAGVSGRSLDIGEGASGEPFVSPAYGIRFELSGDPWTRVNSQELAAEDLLVLVRRSPKITFALRARVLDQGTRESLGLDSPERAGLEDASSYFEASLAQVTDTEDLISREPRTVGEVEGIEYLYRAERAKGSFYHVTWFGIHDGVLYELRTWANAKRISADRLLRQSRRLQGRFSLLGEDAER